MPQSKRKRRKKYVVPSRYAMRLNQYRIAIRYLLLLLWILVAITIILTIIAS